MKRIGEDLEGARTLLKLWVDAISLWPQVVTHPEVANRLDAFSDDKQRRKWLEDDDVMNVAHTLYVDLATGRGRAYSLTALARTIAGFPDEMRPRTETEKKRVRSTRARLRRKLWNVERDFGLFKIDNSYGAFDHRTEYEISASDLLIGVFWETFFPALRRLAGSYPEDQGEKR